MPRKTKAKVKVPTDEEIIAAAAKMRVADPDVNLGDFETMDRTSARTLLKLMGINIKEFNPEITEEDLRQKIRFALWDSQR